MSRLRITVGIVAACVAVTPAVLADRVASTATQDQRAHLDERYELEDVFAKATDNHGEGTEDLYGTRNFRVVLPGIAYRGGANNKWHRQPRNNMNPLPDDALANLCEEGFGTSIYLYRTNFETAPQETACKTGGGAARTLRYLQRSPTDEEQSYDVLRAVFDAIRDSRQGPVYMHCWNGWHASGLAAAKVLRQFCGVSAEDAVRYWDRNTDGHNTEPRYERIRQRIRAFEPYPELMISDEEAARVCPSL